MVNQPNSQDRFEEDLDFTRSKRLQLVNRILAKPELLDDPKMAKVLLSALSDQDKQVLGKQRLKVDEGTSNLAAQAVGIIKELFNDPRLKSMVTPVTGAAASREAPVLGSDIPVPDIVTGEMDIFPQPQDFDAFTRQNEIDNNP